MFPSFPSNLIEAAREPFHLSPRHSVADSLRQADRRWYRALNAWAQADTRHRKEGTRDTQRQADRLWRILRRAGRLRARYHAHAVGFAERNAYPVGLEIRHHEAWVTSFNGEALGITATNCFGP